MSRRRIDQLVLWPLRGTALLSAGIVLLVVWYLIWESLPAWQQLGGTRFWLDESWHPAGGAAGGTFGMGPMIVGTLLCAAGAILLAGPLGVLSAVFCQFYAPAPVAAIYRRMIELLAGIPSVVYGLWGLTSLVPLIRSIQPPGPSLLCGILVLALMILPTVALLSGAALQNVPPAHVQAAAATGLSQASTVFRVVLPAAKGGLAIAVILATARAVGETMAVLMVCGNIVQVPGGLFAPVRTLTANIALELGYASGLHRSALFASGLLLMAAVVLLVAAAEWLQREKSHA